MKFAKHLVGLSALAFVAAAHADPVPFSDGFDTLAAWTLVNNSAPVGLSWFQGNPGIFASQAGAANAYAAADFNSNANASLGLPGPIDNWLISPVLTLGSTGAMLSFYTRADIADGFHDTMQVMFSAGSGVATAGFAPLLTIGADPAVDYPSLWTYIALALPNAATGRIAFRYTGDASTSNYIGVDTVAVGAIPEPSTYALMALGIAGLALVRRNRKAT